MSTQLHQAVKNILEMPYYKNEAARSGGSKNGHESAVAEKVKLAGFSEFPKIQYKKVTKTLLREWAESGNDTELRQSTQGLPIGSYILQPAGSQGFPDILIKDFNDRFVAIECKSSEDATCPMWNDNLPKSNIIYVFTSEKVNKTTIFLGQDVITEELKQSQLAMIDELKQVVEKYKAINEQLDMFKRGWLTKFRPQNFQAGGDSLVNYFNHPSRLTCETNALNYSLQ